ncbi:hypothetical protein AAE02nite_38490 [Adhaeribacter aerolatus]|uniref:Uncharacterized protein n=2 Tax=Adhaeribacter aerolatus TaxID=670289 RepID=A0A512B2J3_9BACT|nr:hypothetical protein AAE02nite_38490 [Adhaeribacter aerolatus]
MVFEFVSEGPQGQIKKLIQYSETNLKDFYNLGFGDKDERTGEIDDTIITNNGDSQKALATVAATVYAFTEKYPDSWIYATGSNIIRTRLYRMGITNNLIEIQKDFVVYGLKGNQWEVFEKEITYDAFLVKRKKK